MPSYTDACGTTTATDSIITVGGINKEGVTGALEGVVFTTDGFSFSSIDSAKLKSNWDAGVAAGSLFYIGKGKFANEGEEATYFEDADFGVRILQTKGTKVLEFRQVVCACSHAKLLELNGKTGRFFFQTKLGFVLGRLEEDRTVAGVQGQVQIEFRPYATSDNPVAETIMTITLSEPESDERNPAELTVDWVMADIDQIYAIEAEVAGGANAPSSDGSTLTFRLDLTESCTDNAMTGLLQADFEVTDENGNALTIASVSENGSTGEYTFQVTTPLTTALVSTAGVITENSILYYMGTVQPSV
jgi:hypothetical protein